MMSQNLDTFLENLVKENSITYYEDIENELTESKNSIGVIVDGIEIYNFSEEALIEDIQKMIGKNNKPSDTLRQLTPEQTGIPQPVWIDDSSVSRNVPHSQYRTKVKPSNSGKRYPVTFFDLPTDKELERLAKGDMHVLKALKNLREFNVLNRDWLIAFYNTPDYQKSRFLKDKLKELKRVKKHYGQ